MEALGFSVKVADIPILMLHTSRREYLTLERSWSNDLHNEVAVKMRWYILERFLEASITILCCCPSSVKRIAALELECQVYSINRYQGRECDFSITVTTGMRMEKKRQNFNFILDAPRTTVALSQTREGVVIVGDRELFVQSDVWNEGYCGFLRGSSRRARRLTICAEGSQV